MNTFFYAACETDLCRRMIDRLKQIPHLEDIIILPCGSNLNTPEALMLRSGDIIFLFAENKRKLDELIAMRADLEGFRLILLIHNQDDTMVHKSHLLKPRFTAFIDQDLNRLETVIDKIILSDCCHCLSSAAV